MRLHKSPWTVFATLTIVFACVVSLSLATGDKAEANPAESFASQDRAEDRFDQPDDSEGRENDFEDDDGRFSDDEFDERDMDEREMDDFDEDSFGHDEMVEFEFHQMEIESNIGRLEMINRLAEIAKDDVSMASYAIMHLEESTQSEEAGIQMLKELIASDDVSHPVKNLLKMKLAELYSWSDQEDAAIDMFKSMMMSK